MAARCVETVLRCEAGDFELILVDQTDGPATANAVAAARSDERFHYLPSSTRGAATARNVGILQARAPIVAFTDDDCRVAPDWVSGIRRVFERDAGLDALFGRVAVPEGGVGSWAAGFAASPRELPPRVYPRFPEEWGISANMACRREVFDRIGMFDPLLGPGSRLRAAEDTDLLIRLHKSGAKIVYAEEVKVDHHGFREGKTLQELMRGYHFAVGAVMVKHARMGDRALLRLFLRLAARTLGSACKELVRTGRPRGAGNFLNLLAGALASFRYDVDARRQLYVERAQKPRPEERAAPNR